VKRRSTSTKGRRKESATTAGLEGACRASLCTPNLSALLRYSPRTLTLHPPLSTLLFLDPEMQLSVAVVGW
jgi:hypothetical protein